MHVPTNHSFEPHETQRTVVHRLFPFERGVFEDKVSNLWCMADVLFKVRRFGREVLIRQRFASGWLLNARVPLLRN